MRSNSFEVEDKKSLLQEMLMDKQGNFGNIKVGNLKDEIGSHDSEDSYGKK